VSATISSVNEFLDHAAQLADGEAYISLYQFDHEFQAMCEATDARLIGEISEETYEPRGSDRPARRHRRGRRADAAPPGLLRQRRHRRSSRS
jgi:hypothetical protein